MRSVGEVLKQRRDEKKMSLEELEKETKIKKSFIKYIEEEKWGKLPEYPVVQGFVKNISGPLDLQESHMVAMLRRDYPPEKDLQINPKPDVSKKFVWSPKMTFITGVVLVFLVILSYLGFQYIGFITPPKLSVETPEEGKIVTNEQLMVSGLTDNDATVKVNNQPVLVNAEGRFEAEIEVFEGTREVVVVAVSRSGKETVIRRNINPELEN